MEVPLEVRKDSVKEKASGLSSEGRVDIMTVKKRGYSRQRSQHLRRHKDARRPGDLPGTACTMSNLGKGCATSVSDFGTGV